MFEFHTFEIGSFKYSILLSAYNFQCTEIVFGCFVIFNIDYFILIVNFIINSYFTLKNDEKTLDNILSTTKNVESDIAT